MFRPGRHPGGGLVSFFRSPRSSYIAPDDPETYTALAEIPQPGGHTFPAWATWTAFTTGSANQLPEPVEASWDDWARSFIVSPPMQSYSLPDPAPFKDWISWVYAVKGVYPGP